MTHAFKDLPQRVTKRGCLIFHPWRYRRIDSSFDEAAILQISKLLYKNLLSNWWDTPSQLSRPARTLDQLPKNEDLPPASDRVHEFFNGAGFCAIPGDGHKELISAYVTKKCGLVDFREIRKREDLL